MAQTGGMFPQKADAKSGKSERSAADKKADKKRR